MSRDGESDLALPGTDKNRGQVFAEAEPQTPVPPQSISGGSPTHLAVESPGQHGVTSIITSGGNDSRKRPRNENSRAAVVYPRKRSIAACRLCRIKKVKCNNARPSCDSCLTSRAECVYADSQDHSSFDPASLLILDRLNEVLQQLGQLQTPQDRLAAPNSGLQNGIALRDDEPIEVQLRIPAAKTAPDAILQWPVFGNPCPPGHLTDAVYIGGMHDGEDRSSSARVTAIDEDAIHEDVQRFLDLVHIKNPVLEVDILDSYARNVAENGLRWDGVSCLILLACALGCVAQPFVPDSTTPQWTTSLESHGDDHRRGSVYYNMARKRLGLVGTGILAAQCHFLAGIYLMYTMQPFDAWTEFRSASQLLYIYLQHQARRPDQQEHNTVKSRHLEQRLYWSCYKSECEFRVEFPLPNGVLADLEYPDMHPSPPDIPSPDDGIPTIGGSSRLSGTHQQLGVIYRQEQSWLYYLTEITLRRMANRILNAFYAETSAPWTTGSIPSMIEAAKEFETQLQDWYNTLPGLIQFEESESAAEELPSMARGRVLEIKAWLYRPFLYYAIHNSPNTPQRSMALPFVEKALFYNFLIVQEDHTRHRHHGTWYSTRAKTSAILCILGAVRCGTISVAAGWEDVVRSGISGFRYWESEAPGLSRSIQVLENLLHFFTNDSPGSHSLAAGMVS